MFRWGNFVKSGRLMLWKLLRAFLKGALLLCIFCRISELPHKLDLAFLPCALLLHRLKCPHLQKVNENVAVLS